MSERNKQSVEQKFAEMSRRVQRLEEKLQVLLGERGPKDDSLTAVRSGDLSDSLAKKQDSLQSGVNIVTINGISLLGQGNIVTPRRFSLPISGSSSSPVDGTTYYFGIPFIAWNSTQGAYSIYVREACVLKIAELKWIATGVAGSNESISVYIRKNNATDTLVASVGDTSAAKTFTNENLAISLAAGDYIEVKMVCPTWVTNPTNVVFSGYLVFEAPP